MGPFAADAAVAVGGNARHILVDMGLVVVVVDTGPSVIDYNQLCPETRRTLSPRSLRGRDPCDPEETARLAG